MSEWPPILSDAFKEKLLEHFDDLVADLCRGEFTCCSCGVNDRVANCVTISAGDMDLSVLRRPDVVASEEEEGGAMDVDEEFRREPWLREGYNISPTGLERVPEFRGLLLDSAGVSQDPGGRGEHQLSFCKDCYSAVLRGKVPDLSMANRLYVGPVPPELANLTVVEENMIAKCRTKAMIIRLQEEQDGTTNNKFVPRALRQRAMKGHIIMYPQHPSATFNVLPPSLDELCKPVAVVFVGSTPPSQEWLEKNARPLAIRPARVRAALLWLIANNPLYRNVEVNHTLLDSLPAESILPVQMEHIVSGRESDPYTASYDSGVRSHPMGIHLPDSHSVDFERVVVADVDVNMPESVLHAAAVNHVRNKNGYLQVPHLKTYMNEFYNPDLFPSMYPTLYPYGLGGFGDRGRVRQVGMRRHIKHLCSLRDQRFQRHSSFLFSAFNTLQRHEMLTRTAMKAKRKDFVEHSRQFVDVDAQTVARVAERFANGDRVTSYNDQEAKVLKLMKEVRVVTSRIEGSAESRVFSRNEIRALMIEKGLPSFFITVNPADVHNPIVRLVAGEKLSMEDLCSRNYVSG
ncbi:hypothetical protein AAF712_012383 [Marasmius tenuissimus]|uniref:Helitron helicase-like domain-containing protein n=1 Tax=Marasmius tenuissimus TaxID=585030 RepID=A0ABR2ZI05_9AGAR